MMVVVMVMVVIVMVVVMGVMVIVMVIVMGMMVMEHVHQKRTFSRFSVDNDSHQKKVF